MGERECGGRENHSAFVARTDFGSHSMTHQATLFSSVPAAFSPVSHSLPGFIISAKKFAEKFRFRYLPGNKISVFFKKFRFENSKFKKFWPKFTLPPRLPASPFQPLPVVSHSPPSSCSPSSSTAPPRLDGKALSLPLAQTRATVAPGRKFCFFLLVCYCTRGD